MAHRSSICPTCGGLNGADETRCFRCGKPLPGPLGRGLRELFEQALGRDYPLTKLYVGLCLGVFVLMALSSRQFTMLGGGRMSEALRWGALLGPLGRIEPWRYLSAMFVHFGALHVGFNMMALMDFGRLTEQRLGSGRFALIFVLTGVVGFVASDFWHAWSGVPVFTAGASGGLFGLTGALVGYLYAARDPAWKQLLMRVAVYAVIFAVAMSVNNAAHAGGFAVGLPLGYAFYKERQPWTRARLFQVVGGLLVILSLASIGLSQASRVWREARAHEIAAGRD
ncbi:MAG: rhomboid family intramembrane serine protease [Polyangiaceae bacterium]